MCVERKGLANMGFSGSDADTDVREQEISMSNISADIIYVYIM